MELIHKYINDKGEAVIRKWERIPKTPATWLSVTWHGIRAMFLLSLMVIALVFVWVIKRAQLCYAWLAWKLAEIKLWYRTGSMRSGL